MVEIKYNNGKDVEILSEEAQEIMNRIPSAIIRWGMVVMFVVVVGILIASAFIRWPKTIECSFEGQQIGEEIVLKTTVSAETLNYLLHTDNKTVNIFSPMLPQKYSSTGMSGTITKIIPLSHSNSQYKISLIVDTDNNDIKTDTIFYGDMQITISENTLLQLLIRSLKKW